MATSVVNQNKKMYKAAIEIWKCFLMAPSWAYGLKRITFSLNWSISTQAQWPVCGCSPHLVEEQICCDWNIGYCTAGSVSLCSSTVEWFICNIYEVLLVQSLLAVACVYSQSSGAKWLPILCFPFGPLKLHCFLLPRYFLEKVGGRKWNCQLANLRIFWWRDVSGFAMKNWCEAVDFWDLISPGGLHALLCRWPLLLPL